jgi:hypothetical protein
MVFENLYKFFKVVGSHFTPCALIKLHNRIYVVFNKYINSVV